MTSPERTILLPELVREYPILEEWFANPSNTTAQLHEGKKLMSAGEKIDYFGGKEQIKGNLMILPKSWRGSCITLLACRQEAMIGFEIAKFSEKVGKKLNATSLYEIIIGLVSEGELDRILGLTFIIRSVHNPGRFTLSDRPGYLTTEQGLRIMAINLEEKGKKEFLGHLSPVPNR